VLVVRTGLDEGLADALALVGVQSVAVGAAVSVVAGGGVTVAVAVGVVVSVGEGEPVESEVPPVLAAAAALPVSSDVGSVVPVLEAEAEGGAGVEQVAPMAVPVAAAEAGRDSTVPYISEPSPSEKATAAAARRLRRKTETPAEETSVEASSIEVF
jgi:hypothetical protein